MMISIEDVQIKWSFVPMWQDIFDFMFIIIFKAPHVMPSYMYDNIITKR